jgi:hypothetical protein
MKTSSLPSILIWRHIGMRDPLAAEQSKTYILDNINKLASQHAVPNMETPILAVGHQIPSLESRLCSPRVMQGHARPMPCADAAVQSGSSSTVLHGPWQILPVRSIYHGETRRQIAHLDCRCPLAQELPSFLTLSARSCTMWSAFLASLSRSCRYVINNSVIL